jgi:hypothetical protein
MKYCLSSRNRRLATCRCATHLVAVACAFALALQVSTTWAGTITSFTGSGPGLGTLNIPVILTVQANNDEVPLGEKSDSNIVVPIKRFDSNNYIDIQFNTLSSDGVTEYQFFESVDNNTGVNWSSYTMILGFGVGGSFVASPSGDGLDFDAPQYNTAPTSSVMPTVGLNEDVLVWSGGIHGAAAQTYQFRIDVPDIGQFTLRQIPTPVPEPATIVLAGLALVAILRCRPLRQLRCLLH